MGVGTPEDLLECVDRGIDMFDCVHPTRMARHGAFWTLQGRFSIRNEKFKTDKTPLQKKLPNVKHVKIIPKATSVISFLNKKYLAPVS